MINELSPDDGKEVNQSGVAQKVGAAWRATVEIMYTGMLCLSVVSPYLCLWRVWICIPDGGQGRTHITKAWALHRITLAFDKQTGIHPEATAHSRRVKTRTGCSPSSPYHNRFVSMKLHHLVSTGSGYRFYIFQSLGQPRLSHKEIHAFSSHVYGFPKMLRSHMHAGLVQNIDTTY